MRPELARLIDKVKYECGYKRGLCEVVEEFAHGKGVWVSLETVAPCDVSVRNLKKLIRAVAGARDCDEVLAVIAAAKLRITPPVLLI